MKRLCAFSAYIAGADMTLADVYVHYVNSVVNSIGSRQLDWDILAEVPGMQEWNRGMRKSEIARTIEADRKADEPDFHAYIRDFLAKNAVPGR